MTELQDPAGSEQPLQHTVLHTTESRKLTKVGGPQLVPECQCVYLLHLLPARFYYWRLQLQYRTKVNWSSAAVPIGGPQPDAPALRLARDLGAPHDIRSPDI
ncbi:hypothetical protein D3C80_1488470 [compost metagenome]